MSELTDKQKSEPAFPCPGGHIECYHPTGMTLRDYFAGQALIALLLNHPRIAACEEAYQYADAMLAERSK